MSQVDNAERQFLLLVARRVLNFRREASARGEAYTDLSPFTRLACGVRAKLRFEDAPGGYKMIVVFKHPTPNDLTDDELKEIAEELANGPVQYPVRTAVGLEYERSPT
jgi:hypothetical protein